MNIIFYSSSSAALALVSVLRWWNYIQQDKLITVMMNYCSNMTSSHMMTVLFLFAFAEWIKGTCQEFEEGKTVSATGRICSRRENPRLFWYNRKQQLEPCKEKEKAGRISWRKSYLHCKNTTAQAICSQNWLYSAARQCQRGWRGQ